ncbi:hypothetical protein F4X88_17380 [Candidatus Poribacteria bacterium]|nr:hypothetical protein [Candidatus Poribacteria bacterium]MYA58057.1 hypothetical protein [Candidatus Poribacteria bacterium]
MKNGTEPIKAAPTARGGTSLDGRRNILTDALYEMEYDDTLVDTLIERNVIDFSIVDYTSHIIYQLKEHYGESVSWGGLEDAVALEGLAASLTGELGKNWRAAEGDTFRERIRHVITDPIENLGMKLISRYELENNGTFSEELENVKQYLAIDYGEFNAYLPDVDFVIYTPENSRVIAVISCIVNLKNLIIEQAYWKRKLQADENSASVKYYLITADISKTLEIVDLPKKERVIAEAELDGTYVLTAEAPEESDKVKLLEHFIEDLKRLLEKH